MDQNTASSLFAIGIAWFLLIMLLVVWSAVWKAIALWRSARNSNLGWFVVFCIINTLGILEILYIYVFSKNNSKNEEKVLTPPSIQV